MSARVLWQAIWTCATDMQRVLPSGVSMPFGNSGSSSLSKRKLFRCRVIRMYRMHDTFKSQLHNQPFMLRLRAFVARVLWNNKSEWMYKCLSLSFDVYLNRNINRAIYGESPPSSHEYNKKPSLCLLLLGALVDQRLVNMWNNTTTSNRSLYQRI